MTSTATTTTFASDEPAPVSDLGEGATWFEAAAGRPFEFEPRAHWTRAVVKTLLPYLVIYVAVGLVLVCWGCRDATQHNELWSVEWFLFPLTAGATAVIGPLLSVVGALALAWLRAKVHRTRSSETAAEAVPEPARTFASEARWPRRHRWTREGRLTLDGEGVAFTSKGLRRMHVHVPWSAVTGLGLAPLHRWGGWPRMRFSVAVAGEAPFQFLLSTGAARGIAALLGPPTGNRWPVVAPSIGLLPPRELPGGGWVGVGN